jgi:membrane protease YdiL (CAAX protease family)
MTPQPESSLKKTWNILMPFVVYFIAHDLAQVLLAFLMNMSLGLGGSYAEYILARTQTVNAVLNALSLLIGMAFVWPMAKTEFRFAGLRREGLQAARQASSRTNTIAAYILLAVFAITLALGTNLLLMLTGIAGKSPSYQDVATRQFGVTFAAGVIIYGVLSPLAEEIVFRGLIYNRMKRYFNPALSIIICGILFGGYHGNLVQGIYGCILGIAIAFSYELFRSFTAPVLFHSLANLSVFIVAYSSQGLAGMMTVLNCLIFLTISFASLVFMWRLKKVT